MYSAEPYIWNSELKNKLYLNINIKGTEYANDQRKWSFSSHYSKTSHSAFLKNISHLKTSLPLPRAKFKKLTARKQKSEETARKQLYNSMPAKWQESLLTDKIRSCPFQGHCKNRSTFATSYKISLDAQTRGKYGVSFSNLFPVCCAGSDRPEECALCCSQLE